MDIALKYLDIRSLCNKYLLVNICADIQLIIYNLFVHPHVTYKRNG